MLKSYFGLSAFTHWDESPGLWYLHKEPIAFMELLRQLVIACWDTLLVMAPYLILGFIAAGILAVFVPPSWIEKHLGKGHIRPLFKAALFGVPLPLCSCAVIPVASSLRRSGAGRGATTSFLLSTPQTGVDSILVTYSLLGWVFALFRPLAALISGMAGGFVVSLTEEQDGRDYAENVQDQHASCHDDRPAASRLKHALYHGFILLPRDIANPLIFGLLLAGLITVVTPEDYFAGAIGAGFSSKLIMMAVGIPLYVCATASVPIAVALIDAGVSPGAALVFLMAGPVTNMASLATMWKILGKRATMVYLVMAGACALAFGVILDLVYAAGQSHPMVHEHDVLPDWFSVLCAVLLLGMLVWARYLKPKQSAMA